MTERNAEERAEGMMVAEVVIQRIAREYEEKASRASSGSERGYYESCTAVAQQCMGAVRGARSSLVGDGSPTNDVARLSEYILRHHGGELAPNENPVDAAIRLLSKRECA